MRKKLWITFSIILLLTIGAGWVSWPTTNSLKIGSSYRDISLRQGLDLKGGIHLAYIADTAGIEGANIQKSMDGVRDVIENRINALGATEPEIRLSNIDGKEAIVVDLPGFQEIDKAKEIIGSTAKLEFRDTENNVVLEGKDLVPQAAQAAPSQSTDKSGAINNNAWQVEIQLTAEGKTKFATATSANVGKQIAIYLDQALISAPTVQSAITDGKAVITGNFTATDAKDFALKLNYGALPVPVSLAQENLVGASLGSDSVNQSLIAGLIGVILVFIFMVSYYRWLGLIACMALAVYALLNIALYKLLPVTLTLAGIAAFIISMGIAIDTNILTFERLKEELRMKKPMAIAIKESFRRSWTSIRDSHISGLISALIIFTFGSGSVRGFALVLIIGTLLSLFSAITVTRNWMLLIAGSSLSNILRPEKNIELE